MRRILLACLALLLVPSATAQAAPTSGLSFEGLSQKYIATEATQLVPVNVVLTISNVVCTASVPLKVTITSAARGPTNASGQNASITAVPSPAELTFTVPQGAYGANPALPTAKPFQGRQTATIAVKGNVTNATTADVSFEAKFAGYTGTDCRGQGAIGAANKDGTFKVDFPATAAPATTTGPDLPLPPTLGLFALLGGLLLMRRRST